LTGGGDLHSLKREHGTIERSGFSSGHNNALTIEEGDASATQDRFGETHYVGNKTTVEMEPHGLSPWYLHKNTLLRF